MVLQSLINQLKLLKHIFFTFQKMFGLPDTSTQFTFIFLELKANILFTDGNLWRNCWVQPFLQKKKISDGISLDVLLSSIFPLSPLSAIFVSVISRYHLFRSWYSPFTFLSFFILNLLPTFQYCNNIFPATYCGISYPQCRLCGPP